MEAFGLLNFIKTVLALSEKQTPSPENATPTDSPPPKQTAESRPSERNEYTPNALSAFLEKHEQLAKKLRK